jgi:multicomponent Na+:H+ antiporter subunit F
MSVIVAIVVVLLVAATGLVLFRVVRGPDLLDRVVGIEALLSIMVGALGAEAAVNRHATTLPILLALSAMGFVGSVSLVRFVAEEEA